MVTTRNGKRTAAEAPAAGTTTKKQKLPVRSKDTKSATKKQPSSRSSSKKRSSLAAGPNAEAASADAQEAHEQQIITGPEQPAPEPEVEEGKVINDSEASPEAASEAQESGDEPVAEKTAPVAEAADDSDSDEAPEAVSTSKAAVVAKKSAQAANKAIAEQAAAQKRKRQERNARLQEQAAERKAQQDAAPEEESNEEEAEKSDAAPEVTGRRRLNKFDLPSELPAEYLDSDSEEEGDDETERKPRKARKLHTAEAQIARESSGPKDEVVGSTVFRVVKKQDERLAPKAQKYSVNAKQALLTRGRAPVRARKGFLV
ncbi:hypothetical protein EsH8_IV_001033 [Colletotrichum jinshuiense]